MYRWLQKNELQIGAMRCGDYGAAVAAAAATGDDTKAASTWMDCERYTVCVAVSV